MRTFLLCLLLSIASLCHAQQKWTVCVTEKSYLYGDGNSNKVVSKPIDFCYNDKAFLFLYQGAKRVFLAEGYTQDKDENGYLTETFINSADDVTERGQFLVTITHSSPAVVLIQNTLFGGSYWQIKTKAIVPIKSK